MVVAYFASADTTVPCILYFGLVVGMSTALKIGHDKQDNTPLVLGGLGIGSALDLLWCVL